MPQGHKRFLSDDSQLQLIRQRMLEQMGSVLEKTEAQLLEAAAAAPAATLLDLGLTSAQGIALKGWVFHELQAELTTFQLLKQPFHDVVNSIEAARRQTVGVSIPDLGPRPENPESGG